jgi:hypothetical protein
MKQKQNNNIIESVYVNAVNEIFQKKFAKKGIVSEKDFCKKLGQFYTDSYNCGKNSGKAVAGKTILSALTLIDNYDPSSGETFSKYLSIAEKNMENEEVIGDNDLTNKFYAIIFLKNISTYKCDEYYPKFFWENLNNTKTTNEQKFAAFLRDRQTEKRKEQLGLI